MARRKQPPVPACLSKPAAGDDRWEHWIVLELFGHTRIAGLARPQSVGGLHFLRVDVPRVKDIPAHTRLFGQGAIYGMSIVSREVGEGMAQRLQSQPLSSYDIRALKEEDDDDQGDNDDEEYED